MVSVYVYMRGRMVVYMTMVIVFCCCFFAGREWLGTVCDQSVQRRRR